MKQTSDIRLRAMEPEDLELLYQVENDEELWHVGLTNVPYSRFVLHEYMQNATGDIYTDKQVRLMVENGDGQVVGILDLTQFDPKHQRAELGLVIARPFRGRGYAEQTMLLCHAYAHSTLHLHQLYAIIAVDNEASLQLFRKLGYRVTAHMADWLFDGSQYSDAVMVQKILD